MPESYLEAVVLRSLSFERPYYTIKIPEDD
jgi:hypothetical protein